MIDIIRWVLHWLSSLPIVEPTPYIVSADVEIRVLATADSEMRAVATADTEL